VNLAELLLQGASTHPDGTAITAPDRVTYGQLADRARRLASRLADAVPPAGPPATVPAGAPLRVLAGELALVERDGRPEAFVTVTGRAVLAPASGNFKDGCAVLERPLRTVAPEFATREGRAGYLVRYREYLCPVTGLRVDSEIIADGDEALHDIVIGRASA